MLEIVPITLKESSAYIAEHHRHHGPMKFHIFSLGIADDTGIVGVAIIGRPCARLNDDGWTLEVSRCCTNGVKNGCSMLYGAAWRAAKALGYRRLITYTLPIEGGISLRASGWKLIGERGGGSWNRKTRPRVDLNPGQRKFLWEAP